MKRFSVLIFLLGIFSASAQNWKKLQEEASSQCDQGNFPKAIEISDKAVAMALKDKKARKEDVLELRAENASYYLLDEQVQKGMELFVPLMETVADGSLPEAEMKVKQTYAVALSYLAQYEEALNLMLRVMELNKTYPLKPAEKVAVIGTIAVCYQNLLRFEKAEEYYRLAMDACKKEGLSNTVDYAFLLSNVALLYHDMRLGEKSLKQFAEAQKVFMSSGDTANPQYPVFLNDYANELAEHYQFEKALALHFRVREIDRRMYGEDSEQYSATLNNIGYVYSLMNRLVETEQFYVKSLEIKEKQAFQRPSSYYTSISNLMTFYMKVGRKKDALELAGKLEQALTNKAFTDTIKRATYAHNLGVQYFSADLYDKSIKYYNETVLYYKAIYGPESDKLAELYVDMAQVLQKSGKYVACSDNLSKAAAIYEKTGTAETRESIETMCNLALIMRNLEKYKEAEAAIDQALELMKKLDVKEAYFQQNTTVIKAMVAADLNNVKVALEHFNRYLEMKYQEIDRDFGYMTETEKMFYLDEFENQIRNFYTAILSHVDENPELIKMLLDFRIRTKGFLLNNITKIRQRVLDKNDPELNRKFEELRLKRESVAKLMSFDTQEYPYALAEATAMKAEADALEKEISAKVSTAGNAPAVMSWTTVQKSLSPGEAAVEIFQSDLLYDKGQGMGTNYTYIILKDKGAPTFVSIDRPKGWEDEVLTSYRNSIENKQNEGDLYRRLWQKVDEKLAGIQTVYVSPDGIYNQVNINSLLNTQTGKYVIEEKSIHVITSLKDLREIRLAKPVKPENCVLVGNPKFDYDITKLSTTPQDVSNAVATRGMYGFVLAELPGTKAEVEVIRSTLEKNGMHAAVFTEVNANEAAVKKLSSPDVLHIATHGFFLEDPAEEQLNGYTKMEKEFYSNPMMRSGIFLTGANQTYGINTGNINSLKEFEDGMLTAYEAMNLRLDNTELVVLSACQTGLGKVKNGEGVFGLQRAFKLAGTRAIIMSLWPVSDEATKDLMISFYDGWTKTGNLYAAFRNAQLETKKKYPQPYYWGAFVLNGR